MVRFFATILFLVVLLPAGAEAATTFAQWKEQFAFKLRRQGLGEATIGAFLTAAEYRDVPIRAQRRQPEKTLHFDSYRSNLLTARRIADGQALLRDYRPFYEQLATRFGVEAEVFVALWGIESSYGQIMGKQPVIASLATLAYAGRRRDFFEKELVAALRMAEAGQLPVERITGSWAGAMGHYQFIPTTWQRFGIDGDGDSRIDLCGSYADAAASAGNYLHGLGWQKGDAAIREVDGKKGAKLLRREGKKARFRPVAYWRQAGLLPAGYPDAGIQLKLVGADDGRTGCFLVGPGFDRLKEWNRSTYFALTVLLLASQIAGPAEPPAITGGH